MWDGYEELCPFKVGEKVLTLKYKLAQPLNLLCLLPFFISVLWLLLSGSRQKLILWVPLVARICTRRCISMLLGTIKKNCFHPYKSFEKIQMFSTTTSHTSRGQFSTNESWNFRTLCTWGARANGNLYNQTANRLHVTWYLLKPSLLFLLDFLKNKCKTNLCCEASFYFPQCFWYFVVRIHEWIIWCFTSQVHIY